MDRCLRRRRRPFALGVALAVASCEAAEEHQPASEQEPSARQVARGDVVSVVQGYPITVTEVQRMAQNEGLSPRRALASIQRRELLAAAAVREGYREESTVASRTMRRAMVRAMLMALVEQKITREQIKEEAIRARYEEVPERFHSPERRASLHLLARVSEGATPVQWREAEKIARAAVGELRGVEDPATLLLRWRAAGRSWDHPVLIEEVPAVGEGDSVEPAYLRALFAQDQPGLISPAIRTSYGWHAAVLTRVDSAKDVSLEAATKDLREEILLERRQDGLEELVEELKRAHPVRRREEPLRTALTFSLVLDSDEPD